MMRAKLLVLVALSFLLSHTVQASSSLPEFVSFQRICVVVGFETDSAAEDAEEAARVERSIAEIARQRFADRGLSFPIDQGQRCYPKNVKRGNTETAIIFRVALRTNRLRSDETIVALILHVQFEDRPPPTHEYPTELFVCDSRDALYQCVQSEIVTYFDKQVMPRIEAGQQVQGRR